VRPLPSRPPVLGEHGTARGRPVGVAIDGRGALLVADVVGNTFQAQLEALAARLAGAGLGAYEGKIGDDRDSRCRHERTRRTCLLTCEEQVLRYAQDDKRDARRISQTHDKG
jgi:hypothetical protein